MAERNITFQKAFCYNICEIYKTTEIGVFRIPSNSNFKENLNLARLKVILSPILLRWHAV